MRIFYRYEYDFNPTDSLKPYQSVLNYISDHNLNYKDILFNIHTFVDKKSKRKSSIEKIITTYPEYYSYFNCTPSKFSDRSNFQCITNCNIDNWNINTPSCPPNLFKIIDEIPKPWNVFYTLAFNQINWFGNSEPNIQISNDNNKKTPTLLPLSSNICIELLYTRKIKVYLTFEVTSANQNETPFLITASKIFGKYNGLYTFVEYNAVEQELIKRSVIVANELLIPFKEIVLKVKDSHNEDIQKVSISNLIKRIDLKDYQYKGCTNGLYTLIKSDNHNNQIKIYLDYRDRLLSGAIRYTGLFFEFHLNTNEIIIHNCDNIIEYIESIITKCNQLATTVFSQIASLYPETPEWYKQSTQ